MKVSSRNPTARTTNVSRKLRSQCFFFTTRAGTGRADANCGASSLGKEVGNLLRWNRALALYPPARRVGKVHDGRRHAARRGTTVDDHGDELSQLHADAIGSGA